jgi:hypothetical protein
MSLRDIVEVQSGPFNKNKMVLMALLFVILGLLSFSILQAGGAHKSAALAMSVCFIWAASGIAYSILVDHFTEGINVDILTRRCVESAWYP